ncbi:hypothetical protein BU15DRAFT_67398 [Melanogaster broomeanus]|nr:hypothetical protein BU15DRAFT_67398 [Melanogaster broomeanus]
MANFNASASMGATQIGSIVMTYLFGISTLQVSLVWLVGAGHAISVTAATYSLTVTHFGNFSSEDIIQISTGFIWAVVLSGAMTSLVQGYFAHRVRVFSKRLYIPVFCWSMSALRFAATVYVTVGALRAQRLWEFLRMYEWLLGSILIGGACLDIIISASMCYYLKREKAFALTRDWSPYEKVVNPFTWVTTEADTAGSVYNYYAGFRSRPFSKGFSAGRNSDYLRSTKSASVGTHRDSLPGHRDIVIEITHETQEHREESLRANVPRIAT